MNSKTSIFSSADEHASITLKHYSVFDIANWFLSKEAMTHKKLQKLCYYAQAWGLALFNIRITDTSFEAWVHGPVSPELFQVYKEYYWMPIPRYVAHLVDFDRESLELLNAVWEKYGNYDGDELEYIVHRETPWEEKREGISPETPSHNIISEQTMQIYYRQKIIEGQGVC